MAVAQDDVLKAVWQAEHSQPNTRIQNVFYWQVNDLVDGDEANVKLDIENFMTTMYGEIQALFSDRYSLESIRITNVTQKTFVSDDEAIAFVGTGGAGEVFPAQDAALVLARSRQLGHVGRKYIGPILENVMENGELGAGAAAALQQFCDDWDAPFVGGVTNNVYLPGTAKFNPGGGLNSFRGFLAGLGSVIEDARTQRRRRPSVGLS